MTDTIDVIRVGWKSRYLNNLERYNIYKISRNNLHMSDIYIEEHNPIYQTVQELCYR
jgi:hypothetical protein